MLNMLWTRPRDLVSLLLCSVLILQLCCGVSTTADAVADLHGDVNVMEDFRSLVKEARAAKASRDAAEYGPLPPELLDPAVTPYIMLNVGGISPVDGWYNVNAQRDPRSTGPASSGNGSDSDSDSQVRAHSSTIIRRMDDLHGFPDRSVSLLYSSHTLEHASSTNGDVFRTLKEWHRVLRYGGLLMVSVPDFETLSRLFLRRSYFESLHWSLVSIMFGAQRDPFDFHVSAFDEKILRGMLREAGFCSIERVGDLNMFPPDFDASTYTFLTVPISLNMLARPCVPADIVTDGFLVGHRASPHVPVTDDAIPEYDEALDLFYTHTVDEQGGRVRVYHEDWEYGGPTAAEVRDRGR